MSSLNLPTVKVTEFTGINNKLDPEMVGVGGFVVADNVDIDSSGKHLFGRDGRASLSATAYLSAYATTDARRCYAVTAAGDLVLWTGSASTLRSGFVGYPYWLQVGDFVFVGNQNQCWRIDPSNIVEDNASTAPDPVKLTVVNGTLPPGQYRIVQVALLPSGRESAPSVEATITLNGAQNIQVSGITGQRLYVCPADSKVFGWWIDTTEATMVYGQAASSLGEELTTLNLKPMPSGRCLAMYEGRLYSSLYDIGNRVSFVSRSVPMYWDLYEPTDIKVIPGEVRAMAGLQGGLVICTDRQIMYLDSDDKMTTVAEYGVPPGQSISFDQKIIGEEAKECWIFTLRGVCKMLPFLEVTPQFAPPVSGFVGTAVVRKHGDERFVAMLSPLDSPDNPN